MGSFDMVCWEQMKKIIWADKVKTKNCKTVAEYPTHK